MQLLALCCGTSLLLLVLPWAGVQQAGGEHGVELRSLQALLEELGQLWEEEGEALLQLLRDEDGKDRRTDGAGMQRIQSPSLEEREKLKLGPAPKRFLSIQASVQQPGSP